MGKGRSESSNGYINRCRWYPNKIDKAVRTKSKEALRRAAGSIIMNGTTPKQWRLSRMSSIYKEKGDKADISNYCPITATSVVYMAAMQIIKQGLQAWVENENVLAELQKLVPKRKEVGGHSIFINTVCRTSRKGR